MNITKNVTSTDPQFAMSYFQALLTYNNVMPGVADLDYSWMETWNFMKSLSPKSYATQDPEGKFHRMMRKRQVNNAIVASNAANGALLDVFFTDVNHSGFRKGDVLFDGSMNFGRVVDTQPGKVTLESWFTPATIGTGHFAANSKVFIQSDASGNFYTGGKTYLHRENDVQTDYTAVQRNSGGQPRRGKIKTFFGNSGTIAYVWSREEQEAFEDLMKQYSKKVWLSEIGTKDSIYQGQINSTRGVRRSIIDDGAAYLNSSQRITRATLEDFVITVAEVRGGGFAKSLTLVPGRNAYKAIAEFYPDQLAFTGSTNTPAGQVYNLNVKTIIIAGVTVNIAPMNWLNDSQEVPAWMSDSIYVLDLNPIPNLDGPGTQSPLVRIHWGDEGEQDATIMKGVPGMTGNGQGNSTGGSKVGMFEMTSSAIDGYSFEMLNDNGISFIASASGLFEFQY